MTPSDFQGFGSGAKVQLAWRVGLDKNTIVPQSKFPFALVFVEAFSLEPGEFLKANIDGVQLA